MIGFEIDNTFILISTIIKLLQKNLDIKNIQKQNFFDSSEIRIRFVYKNKHYIVWEPFGDNSRYWIGPSEEEIGKSNNSNIKEIENIFIKHKSFYFF